MRGVTVGGIRGEMHIFEKDLSKKIDKELKENRKTTKYPRN